MPTKEFSLHPDVFGVQFITHYTGKIDYIGSAMLALQGGCRWIQLRMKDSPTDDVFSTACTLAPLCREAGATFILDDHVELVRETGADGVHLGKLDMPVDEARRILGDKYIIGGTANIFEDMQRLHAQGADYIGCGPFRYTTTKKNLAPVLGAEGYKALIRQMEEHGINLPMVAIGGIGIEDFTELKSAGIKGIALSGSILRAEDPAEMMRNTMQQWHNNSENNIDHD